MTTLTEIAIIPDLTTDQEPRRLKRSVQQWPLPRIRHAGHRRPSSPDREDGVFLLPQPGLIILLVK